MPRSGTITSGFDPGKGAFRLSYFASERVNKGRQPELDWLKAFCIVCMIFLHIYEDCAIEQTSPIYHFLDYACIFTGAACFMICMGVGMRYSRKQSPADYVYRGIEILTVGQLLNLLRNALPNLIAWWIKGEQFFIANSLLVVQADILSFAGIAFLLIALLKKLKVPDVGILAIGFVMNVLALTLSRLIGNTSSFPVDVLIGYFVVNDAYSFFPLTSYFVFVAFGYFIGGIYPRIADKKGLANRVLLICLPVCVAYYVLRMSVPFPLMPEFGGRLQYITIPGPDAVAQCLSALAILALFYRLTELMGGKAPALVNQISGNINQYYCVSYMFTFPMMTILIATCGHLMPGGLLPFVYGLFTLVACYFIIKWNSKHLHFGIAGLRGAKRKAVFCLIWALTIAVVLYAMPRIETFATPGNNYLLP